MARVGLNLSIRELAQLSDMNKATIVRIEAGYPVRESSLSSVRETLESKGAMFWRCQKINKVLISVDNTEVL
jgi:predicted transcriptional regulator